jgi:hypothetical protein
MMRYNENMIRLLDPIIADGSDLDNLVQDLKLRDPRWHNGSLDEPLKQRLGSESDRFFRILGRMKDVMDDLGRLLQIENGKVCTPSRGSPPSPRPPRCVGPNFRVRQVVSVALPPCSCYYFFLHQANTRGNSYEAADTTGRPPGWTPRNKSPGSGT